jgi:lysozyme
MDSGYSLARIGGWTKKEAEMARAIGTDVSFWNGNVDFVKMAAAGASFVFVKASELFTDSKFATFWPAAKAAGLLRGAFHYMNWNASEIDQATLFCALLTNDTGELPPTLDLEDDPTLHNLSAAEVRGKTWNFLNAVEKATGKVPMLYCGYYFWKQWGNTDPAWAKYPFWLPWYANEAIIQVPPPWTKWNFWQYTSNGSGPTYGSQSLSMDMSYFNGTVAELRAFAHVSTPVPLPQPGPGVPNYLNYRTLNAINVRTRPVADYGTFVRTTAVGEVLHVKDPEIAQNGYVQLTDETWVWKTYLTRA